VFAQPKGDVVEVKVIDTGRGIPAESLPHIFDRFYRVQGSEEEAEGTGLGLSIVKSIVEKHGGKISVESKEGQGSTFVFTVPVGEEN
jgi:signal transduction histidine kinase